MPKYARRRTSRRPIKRRSNRRVVSRRRRGSRRSRVVSRAGPFPGSYLTKLRYSEGAALSFPGTSVPVHYRFHINSIFDPNLTGTGHQPLGHDQFSSLYNKYRVYGMKYRITFTNRDTNDHAEVAVILRPNASAHLNMETVRESPLCVFKATLGTMGSGQGIRTCTGYASVSRIRGISKYVMRGENDYSAIIGYNPQIMPTLQVYLQNPITTNAVIVDMRVDFQYYVEFFDRKLLTQS